MPVYDLPVGTAIRDALPESSQSSLLKVPVNGVSVKADMGVDSIGVWDVMEDGSRLWRAAFRAEGALAMNLVFKPYRLNRGVRLFLYDSLQGQILGAFSDLNNKYTELLATSWIRGETIYAEMQVPSYQEEFGRLGVASAGCITEPADDSMPEKDGWYGRSGECNQDIACFEDADYQINKQAVVRIVYSGGERCTGTLVNNGDLNGRNYVLTAKHCISTEPDANEALFYFGYESPLCDGDDGDAGKSLSGATIRAGTDDLDFVLLELLEPVPVEYRPYYAGWDATGTQPQSGYTIHHPQGDVKKVAVDNDALSLVTFNGSFLPNSHWKVSRWDNGTTEAGSSGAPFFDQKNRIVGTLTGGKATCDNPVDDYFQAVHIDWNHDSRSGGQLKYWLDPQNKGIRYIDGFDPYHSFWETADTLTNIQPGEEKLPVPGSYTWGSLSGHNPDHLTQFAERYALPEEKKLFGLLIEVGENYAASAESRITVRLWKGTSVPDIVLAEQDVMMGDLTPYATALVRFAEPVSVRDTFFAGYEVYYTYPDTFSVLMAGGRSAGDGNTAWVHDGIRWQSLPAFTSGAVYSSYAVYPVVYDSLAEPEPWPYGEERLVLYPNPSGEVCWIVFSEMTEEEVKLELISMGGQVMHSGTYGRYQRLIRLDTGGLSDGIYVLRIMMGDQILTRKLAVSR